jgi:hypothetical protein
MEDSVCQTIVNIIPPASTSKAQKLDEFRIKSESVVNALVVRPCVHLLASDV